MIDFVTGELVTKEPTRAVILAGGVGFDLFIPYSSFLKLPEKGQPAKLLAHLVHRENAMELFGFASPAERELFRRLISVSGIGPKTALSVLSGIEISDFIYAVQSGESKYLTKISGIGAKTAQRLVLELKDSLKNIAVLEPVRPQKAPDGADAALSVLIALGYKEPDAISAIKCAQKKCDFNGISLEEIVKLALKEL